MKRSVLLALCIPFMFTAPASADDMKQEVGKIVLSYMDCYTKQDPGVRRRALHQGRHFYQPGWEA